MAYLVSIAKVKGVRCSMEKRVTKIEEKGKVFFHCIPRFWVLYVVCGWFDAALSVGPEVESLA
jgi:hypothetical protein